MEGAEIDHLGNAPTDRIAIVGAGAAGLTAAETLRELGYSAVTVFERSDRAGGKCSSPEINGRRYELGAGILSENNRTPLRFVERYKVPMQQAEFGRGVQVDGETGQELPTPPLRDRARAAYQLLTRYRALFKRFPEITTPGHVGMHADLMQPYTQFAQKYRIEELTPYMNLFFTGFGYSYLDTVPAAYVLKYNNWETVQAFRKKKIYTFPDGIQSIWNTVAEHHDVRYSTTITDIHRGDVVTITLADGTTHTCDKLIVAAPLDETALYMDLSTEESGLFKQIQHVTYVTVAATLHGFPKVSGYVPSNFVPARAGQPVFWYHRHIDAPVYTFYALAKDGASTEQMAEPITAFVKRVGGSVKTIHTVEPWKYFPHVTTAAMEDGFYEKIEDLQGRHRTTYIGEVLNFSAVGFTSEHAEFTVRQRFALPGMTGSDSTG